MKKNNPLTTSIVCEGKADREFSYFLKTDLYKVKHPVCKKHTQIIGGSIKLDNIKKDKKDCCKTFYFFDKDDLREETIKRNRNKIEEQEDIYIISKPQIEVCLLAIFEKHPDTNMDKKTLENKLTKHIKDKKIFNEKYEHNLQSLEKIMKHLKKIVEDENNEYSLEKFEENLEHYASNELLHTNIIEYIRHLKKE